MPLGSYPGRVKDFKKWAAGMIDKADISNRATSSTRAHSPRARRRFHVKRRRNGLKRKRKKED